MTLEGRNAIAIFVRFVSLGDCLTLQPWKLKRTQNKPLAVRQSTFIMKTLQHNEVSKMTDFTIPRNNLFATPESEKDLFDRIQLLSGQERAIATTYAIMMMNLLSKMQEEHNAKQ